MKWFEMPDQLPNSTNSIEQIAIKDLFDYYPIADPLRGVNLILKKGQITCLLGDSCSGKSTIASLLERRHNYSQGSIDVDGQELKDLSKKDWLSKFTIIARTPFFSHKTLADNIAAKSCTAEEEANVVAFCKIYGFHQYITKLKKGYKTVLGDAPLALTEAQSQLIALARALYPCPDVLVLNESTTAMDFRMERHALDILHRIKEHMIILLITGRPKVAYRSDYVYLLNDGLITKKGEPEAITAVLERLI